MDGVEGQIIMPFYIVCDVSSSMVPDMPALNEAVRQLRSDIMADPVVDDLVMLGIITFSHEAHTAVPLGPASEISLPQLQASGGTEYGRAFQEYHRAFEADRARLKSEGKRVYRPCVFFLSDGEPNDRSSYLQTFRLLIGYDPETKQGNRAFPYVVAFGFRDARKEVMESIAYPNFGPTRGRWFLAAQGSSVGELLKSIADAIGRTVLKSGKSASAGKPQIEVPEPPAGMQFGEAGDIL